MLKPSPTNRFVMISGLRLHYLEWGAPDSPPVVCLHGYTSSAEAFSSLARALPQFRILALDVRGHGESAWSSEEAYQYRDQAADLAAFADELNLPYFALIGTSMGGIIAMVYASIHPERLSGLIINDIGPDVEEGNHRITRLMGYRPHDFPTLDAAMAYRRRISLALAGRSLEEQRELALGVLREDAEGRWRWKMDPAYIRQRVEHGPPIRPDLWPVLQTLPCPALVVWGMESDVLSEAQARRMTDVLPKGSLLPLPKTAHAPTLAEPEAMPIVTRFLEDLPGCAKP